MSDFLKTTAAIFAIQVAAYVPSYIYRTERFYDLTGSLTFAFVAISSYWRVEQPTWRNAAVTGCQLLWAVRLGYFLFVQRAMRHEDVRFRQVKQDAKRFLIYWLVQGVWITAVSLPVTMTNLFVGGGGGGESGVGVCDVLAYGAFCAGLALEAVADSQKIAFKENSANKGKFISSGVWSWSQHPNYAGEIALQTGLASAAAVAACAANASVALQVVPFVAPALTAHLLIRVSGIPILDKLAKKRWGNDKDFQKYFESTPKLFPGLF